MKAEFYDDVDEFYDIVFPFLAKREAENNLMLAILNALKKDIQKYGQEKPLLFLISENNKIELVSIRTPPHDLLISCTDDLDTIDLLINELMQRGETLPGILSFKHAADKFAKIWAKKHNLKLELLRNERVYKLEKVAKNTLGSKKFVNATKEYENFILKCAREFMIEALAETGEEQIDETLISFQKQLDEGRSDFFYF